MHRPRMKPQRRSTEREHQRLLSLCLCASVVLPPLSGCAAAARDVFPTLFPPIVWPAPPDTPRVRYVGELRGEDSLGVPPRGLAALGEVLAGPRPKAAFVRPCAVAVAGEVVFVADTGLAGVHRLDLAQRTYALLRGAPGERLKAPIDVAIVGERVVVADRGRAALEWFDVSGAWRRTERHPELAAPVAVAWDDARTTLWLADAAAHALFAARDGAALVKAAGGRGAGPGEFNFPCAVAPGRDAVFVADSMNFRVQVLDAGGRPVAAFGRKGDAAGDFALPRDVAVDSEGHVYVLDNQFENVQIFDAQGRLLLAFGRGGRGPGEFSLPSGITIDALDRIWIADSYNRRVQVFQYLAQGAEQREPAPAAQAPGASRDAD